MADRCEEAREEFSSSQERREVPVVSEAGEPSRPSQTVPPPVMPVPQGARADENAAFRAQLLAAVSIFSQVMQNPRFMDFRNLLRLRSLLGLQKLCRNLLRFRHPVCILPSQGKGQGRLWGQQKDYPCFLLFTNRWLKRQLCRLL